MGMALRDCGRDGGQNGVSKGMSEALWVDIDMSYTILMRI